MTETELIADLEQALAEMPRFDPHTHLVGGRLGARGLHDILLYHMVISDLYAAGCPNGTRLTQYPGWPEPVEAHRRIEEALPYLPKIRNTSCAWMLRMILRDLYGWDQPITSDNWRRLDAMVRERADDRAWQHSIFDRLKIRRTCAEHARRARAKTTSGCNTRWSGRSSPVANGANSIRPCTSSNTVGGDSRSRRHRSAANDHPAIA